MTYILKHLPKNTVFFISSMSNWTFLSSASYSIAKELSKTYKVFYLDNPYTYKDLLTEGKEERIKGRREAPKYYQPFESLPNLTIVHQKPILPINWISNSFVYRFFAKINNDQFERSIQQTIEDYNIDNYVFLNSFNPFYGKTIHQLSPSPLLTIYQSRDDIEETPYAKKHGVRLEDWFVKHYDIGVATSEKLCEKISKRTQIKVQPLENAVDFEVFQHTHTTPPKDVPINGKKNIGYMGNLSLRIDFELLLKIATTFENCNLILIGPKDFPDGYEEKFEALSNVFLIGLRPIEKLGQYLSFMDTLIIPFLQNEFTSGMYSLKINEFLAQSKPLVTTNYSSSINQFSKLIYQASTHQEFINELEKALTETPSQEILIQRKETARKNGWNYRVLSLLEKIDEKLNKKYSLEEVN